MPEHREYCGAVLRELRGDKATRVMCSEDAGAGGMQSVAGGGSSDAGTTDLRETVATVQMLQEEVRALQGAMRSIEAEI